jgi:hypothetical protein
MSRTYTHTLDDCEKHDLMLEIACVRCRGRASHGLRAGIADNRAVMRQEAGASRHFYLH